MKVVVFNDTRVNWLLHSGSERGINGERKIPRQSAVTFEGTDGAEVFVKVWGKVVMVRFIAPGTAEAMVPIRRGTPGRGRSRMPSDTERMDIEARAGLHGAVRDIRRGDQHDDS